MGLGGPDPRAAEVPEFRDSEGAARGERRLPVGARSHDGGNVVAIQLLPQNFNTLVLTIFGCSALLLAAIGIYGLMAYSVAQRAQEIGIRLALGAESSHIRNMVVLQGLRLALAGVAMGLAAAFGLTRLIASLLFGVKPWDPLVFCVVPAVLAMVAADCSMVAGDAREPGRSHPRVAVRNERVLVGRSEVIRLVGSRGHAGEVACRKWLLAAVEQSTDSIVLFCPAEAVRETTTFTHGAFPITPRGHCDPTFCSALIIRS